MNTGAAAGARASLVDKLSGDALLHSLLRSTVNTDFRLERVLTGLRRTLVLDYPLDSLPLAFASALAIQCFLNEYVFCDSGDERKRLREIESQIATAGAQVAPEVLTTYALFAPLHTLPNARLLADMPLETWPPPVRKIVEMTLVDPLTEQAIKPSIDTLGSLTDATSITVREQYETNPYPRWIHLPQQEPCTAADYLRQRFPHFDPPEFLDRPIDVLIAGCGTGQHAAIAAATYSNASITAIDLSLSSLAYATRMTRQLGFDSIRFIQSDILQVERLENHFGLVESIGVLHHMRDPSDGWSTLSRVLLPGGVFNVGLYSESARQVIVRARDRIKSRNIEPTPQGIRQFRTGVLSEGAGGPFARLLDTYDFFTISSCRDLLFHVQEHRFTLPQIASLIGENQMRFIGFDFDDDEIGDRFSERFPNGGLDDIDLWCEFDRSNPGLIKGYVFWCQKL